MLYHGLKNTTSRVIYLHGSFDPWNGLGLTEPKSDDSISIFIDGNLLTFIMLSSFFKIKMSFNIKSNYIFLGVSHCADLYTSSLKDPPQLSEARETVIFYLNKWLTEN